MATSHSAHAHPCGAISLTQTSPVIRVVPDTGKT